MSTLANNIIQKQFLKVRNILENHTKKMYKLTKSNKRTFSGAGGGNDSSPCILVFKSGEIIAERKKKNKGRKDPEKEKNINTTIYKHWKTTKPFN
jgi:hypothetical protein